MKKLTQEQYIKKCKEVYNGKYDYSKPIDFFGGLDFFNNRKKKDSIRSKHCQSNNIYLIRIPYMGYKNIDFIIKEKIIESISV